MTKSTRAFIRLYKQAKRTLHRTQAKNGWGGWSQFHWWFCEMAPFGALEWLIRQEQKK